MIKIYYIYKIRYFYNNTQYKNKKAGVERDTKTHNQKL